MKESDAKKKCDESVRRKNDVKKRKRNEPERSNKKESSVSSANGSEREKDGRKSDAN